MKVTLLTVSILAVLLLIYVSDSNAMFLSDGGVQESTSSPRQRILRERLEYANDEEDTYPNPYSPPVLTPTLIPTSIPTDIPPTPTIGIPTGETL